MSTTGAIEFGWFIPTNGDGRTLGDAATAIPPSPELFVRVARAAEEAGFEYLLVPVATTCWEAWIVTAMLVPQTTSIDMLVAARPGLIQPTLMAKMVATFDQLSGGRVRVNLIAGGGVEEMAADGVFLDHDERYALMDETVELMKKSWAERRPFDFEGRHVRVVGADVRPKPLQQPHPPFYIGGISPAAVEVGAKHASVYLFWANTVEQIRADIETVRTAAAAHSRADDLRLGLRAHVLVRDTAEQARADAEGLIARTTDRQRAVRQQVMGNQSHADARMRALGTSLAERDHWLAPNLYAGVATVRHGAGVVIAGSAEQVAETIQSYVDLGITSFCLSGWPHDEEAERFGELVLPAFR